MLSCSSFGKQEKLEFRGSMVFENECKNIPFLTFSFILFWLLWDVELEIQSGMTRHCHFSV